MTLLNKTSLVSDILVYRISKIIDIDLLKNNSHNGLMITMPILPHSDNFIYFLNNLRIIKTV